MLSRRFTEDDLQKIVLEMIKTHTSTTHLMVVGAGTGDSEVGTESVAVDIHAVVLPADISRFTEDDLQKIVLKKTLTLALHT